MREKTSANLSQIEMLVLDIDGVMTDGTLIINEDGTESKHFNSLDGHGLRLWKRAGGKLAFLSGRECKPVAHRARQLEVDYVLQDCFDKLGELEKLIAESGIDAERIAYVVDDLPDLPAMGHVGFAVAVANAVEQVKQHADYVTTAVGGSGAVREVIEHILKSAGKWSQLMTRYLPAERQSEK